MALLATEALGLDDCHALQADFLQGFLHVIELERLDDGFNLFHREHSHHDAFSEAPFWTGGDESGSGGGNGGVRLISGAGFAGARRPNMRLAVENQGAKLIE
jgi:hypothetical protein